MLEAGRRPEAPAQAFRLKPAAKETRVTALEMPSSYRAPDLKKQLSARVRQSSHAKLANVREIWRVRAEETERQLPGETVKEFEVRRAAMVDAIDNTHIIDELLARVLDDELAQWGGFAETPEKLTAQLKLVRETSRKQR